MLSALPQEDAIGSRIRSYFQFEAHHTDLRREVIGGTTTFLTMSYIIVVNPAILSAAGIPAGPSAVATILTAIFGTLLMGLYARRPFAVAPYMGENAFLAFTVVGLLHYSWQAALGAVFLGGLLFVLLTVMRVRQWLVSAVPPTLRYSFAVGVGLFMTFIGLNVSGIVKLGTPGAPVHIGDLRSAALLVSVFSFLLMAVLMIRRAPGAILLGILGSTVVSYVAGVAAPPEKLLSMPPSLEPIFLKMDLVGALDLGFFAVVLTVFVMSFVDTMGTLIGVAARAGFLDAEGNLPQIERPMLVDALATTFAAAVGTTTAGAYIESATGVEAGGRTGFSAVVTAGLFALALFFSPFVAAIPPQAYGPALIIVGLLMLEPITRINFSDLTELIPAFAVVTLMSFTYNLGIGITAGFVLYPFAKLVAGRKSEVRSGMWVLGSLSLLFFIFYPYA
ncbi:MAG TPA: NCS2 family permease [Terriglobales bacterium]|nr:NCS2 family permease [Terriglobales bacterium]